MVPSERPTDRLGDVAWARVRRLAHTARQIALSAYDRPTQRPDDAHQAAGSTTSPDSGQMRSRRNADPLPWGSDPTRSGDGVEHRKSSSTDRRPRTRERSLLGYEFVETGGE